VEMVVRKMRILPNCPSFKWSKCQKHPYVKWV
jgi:hypothetical protein